MRKHLSNFSAAVLLLSLATFGLAGCGGDSTGPGDVSPEKAAQVAEAVNTAAGMAFGTQFNVTPGNTVPADMATVSAETFTWDNQSVSCPVSGSVTMNGSITVTETSSTRAEFDWQSDTDYGDCGVQVDNSTFVLNTSTPLSIDGSGVIETDGSGNLETYDFSWTYSGNVNWNEEGGPDGTCSIDLTGTMSIDADLNITGSVKGTSCGQSVNETWSA